MNADEWHRGEVRKMVGVREACRSECPGMHTPLFRKSELDRAEVIVSALDGLDIYSAQKLLERVQEYILQTTFTAIKD